MAEKEETITVAVRLPASHVVYVRNILSDLEYRNISEFLRDVVANWIETDREQIAEMVDNG